jgi:hypothetical protein
MLQSPLKEEKSGSPATRPRAAKAPAWSPRSTRNKACIISRKLTRISQEKKKKISTKKFKF